MVCTPVSKCRVRDLYLSAKPLDTAVPRIIHIEDEPSKTDAIRGPAPGMKHQSLGVVQAEPQHLLPQSSAVLGRSCCTGNHLTRMTRAGELDIRKKSSSCFLRSYT
jgi:hypothetical protein